MKRKYILAFIIISLTIVLVCCKQQHEIKSNNYYIAVVSIVEIDPIIELRKGFLQKIYSSQFAKKHKVIVKEYNAQNDPSLINQIVDKLSVEKPDLIYVLGTPIAQAIQKRIPDVLLVQGTATDPIAAGLADSWQGSGRKYIATTDMPPLDKQIKLIEALTPQAKRLGIIYNPGETNSVSVVSKLRAYVEKGSEIRLVERPISNSSEVAASMRSLLGKADAIYLPPDNTAYAAIPVIGKLAREYKMPFYATVDSAIINNALATLSLDFRIMGEETATLALRVLGGEDPAKIPIQSNENPVIKISAHMAQELGLKLDQFSGEKNIMIVN